MQGIDWIASETGHQTTLVMDPVHTQRTRATASRTANLGLVVLAAGGFISALTHGLIPGGLGLAVFVATLFLSYAQGSAQVWYRRLTLRGSTLEFSWFRHPGIPGAQAITADLIRSTTTNRLLFAAPAPVSIALSDIESAEIDEQTLRLTTAERVEEVNLSNLVSSERDVLVDYLRKLAANARRSSPDVAHADRAALAALRERPEEPAPHPAR